MDAYHCAELSVWQQVHSVSNLGVDPGTQVYCQWKRKNKARTDDASVSSKGGVRFAESMVDAASMLRQPEQMEFDSKVWRA